MVFTADIIAVSLFFERAPSRYFASTAAIRFAERVREVVGW